ncbi:MAG TPA: hypothetical protein VHA76_06240 [Solirubrobacterales bacterium]|nr:hypothetical protein [Solirubrobacterales bacterium]
MNRRLTLPCLLALLAALALPAVAAADLTRAEHDGGRIAQRVRTGETSCAELSAGEAELVGEYAMGRYLGTTARHAAMNRHMVAVMGDPAERRMHVALGERYAGCRGDGGWGWMSPMAAMMRGGRGPEEGGYPAGMMGSRYGTDHSGGMSTGAIIAIGAVLIGAAALGGVWFGRRRQGTGGPGDGAG